MNLARANKINQVSWVVPDLHDAMKHWTGGMNVGPFFVYEHVEFGVYKYRGKPLRMDQSIALSQANGLQIELIQVHTEGLSPYREVVPQGRLAFHHVAAIAGDLRAEVDCYLQAGYDILAEGDTSGIPFFMIDAWATQGCMIELIADHPAVHQISQLVDDAVRTWDGRDPIRSLR